MDPAKPPGARSCPILASAETSCALALSLSHFGGDSELRKKSLHRPQLAAGRGNRKCNPAPFGAIDWPRPSSFKPMLSALAAIGFLAQRNERRRFCFPLDVPRFPKTTGTVLHGLLTRKRTQGHW